MPPKLIIIWGHNMTELPPIPARLPEWRARLANYLGAVSARRFRPGRHDCAIFAAGAVEAITGLDLADAWRGKYISLGAGRAMLRAKGFQDHLALAVALFPEVPPALAQVGDLAALPGDAGFAALGVIQGPGVYVLTPAGLSVVSRLHVEKAFSV